MKIARLFFFAIATTGTFAQSLQFEVASVKPASEEEFMAALRSAQRPRVGITIEKGRAEFIYMPLMSLVVFAYGLPPLQVTGPEFLKTTRVNILAKLPPGATDEQVPKMLEILLTERFGLKVHREKKEIQIYALIVGKNGLNPKKMKPATAEEIAPEPMPGDVTQTTPFGKMTRREIPGKGMIAFIPGMGTLKTAPANGGGAQHLEMSNMTPVRFAQLLASESNDRLIVDKTNLKGSYEVSFDVSMEPPPPPPPPGAVGEGGTAMVAAPRPNPMFQAVEQLGLKLEPQKDQVEMLVIDHIEKTPTDN